MTLTILKLLILLSPTASAQESQSGIELAPHLDATWNFDSGMTVLGLSFQKQDAIWKGLGGEARFTSPLNEGSELVSTQWYELLDEAHFSLLGAWRFGGVPGTNGLRPPGLLRLEAAGTLNTLTETETRYRPAYGGSLEFFMAFFAWDFPLDIAPQAELGLSREWKQGWTTNAGPFETDGTITINFPYVVTKAVGKAALVVLTHVDLYFWDNKKPECSSDDDSDAADAAFIKECRSAFLGITPAFNIEQRYDGTVEQYGTLRGELWVSLMPPAQSEKPNLRWGIAPTWSADTTPDGFENEGFGVLTRFVYDGSANGIALQH